MALGAGTHLGPYEIQSLIGAGGMGEVYKAKDTRLDRIVAIKVLPSQLTDPERRARFEREAKTVAGLNHPHICTLYDVGEHEASTFLVMEYVAGESLAERLRNGPLPVEQALAVATEIADALASAHRQSIIHRDLKPANIMLTPRGAVKVLDFGLAKHVSVPANLDAEAATVGVPIDQPSLTQSGFIVGTVAYLSPEQLEGRPQDARSDIFSFGVVFYELLTGQRPFQGDSPFSTMSAILRDTPGRPGQVRAGVSPRLDAIVNRCLEKDPDARYASAAELHHDLIDCQSKLTHHRASAMALFQNPRVAVPALVVIAALLTAGSWSFRRASRAQWAHSVAIPEIRRLLDEGRSCAAFRLVRQVEHYLPSDAEIARIRRNFMRPVLFTTDPPGADIYVHDYIDPATDAQWDYVGRTPVNAILIPIGQLRYRIVKPGFVTVEGYTASAITGAMATLNLKLDPDAGAPPGMVRVPAQNPVGEFWLDKYEVTNRQFREFIGHGGYQNAEYWKEPFVKAARAIGRDEAMAEFRDATGRPGPATWEYGTFLEGQEDYPVGGLSWYEAAAYCEFQRKALPTVHHWRSAAVLGPFATILETSNFAGRGPARVGSYSGLGPFGTYDTAGNVREWCFNASGEKRYCLGGAWNDPKYLFYLPDARPPFDRSAGNGVRCASYKEVGTLREPIDPALPSGGRTEPVSDAVFQVYKAFHAYEHGQLDPKVEGTDETSPYWRVEKASFRAAYGNERVVAYLFLPRNADPPFQTVVTFPGTYAFDVRSSAKLEAQWFDFIVRSGRAVLHPVYKGTYERSIGRPFASFSSEPALIRELAVEWYKDLGRSIDYLETRPEFDRTKIAYQGISLGAAQGPRMMALDSRLRVGILLWGGLGTGPAEINALNFASRSYAPTLMVNGRSDLLFPLESSQRPMFRQLGTALKDKRHIVINDAGHVAFNQYVVREVLGWLDRYLGPVSIR